jgi:hypothetical protein
VTNLRQNRLATPIQRFNAEVTQLRDDRRRAVLSVCQHGRSIDDVRLLLDVLGLDPREGRRDYRRDDVVPVGSVNASTAFNVPGRLGS